MSDIKILGQGSYGCVITPSLACKTKKTEIYDTVKIVENSIHRSDFIKKEIAISKHILKKKTPSFNPEDYYCLILNNCKLGLNVLNNEKLLKYNSTKISDKIIKPSPIFPQFLTICLIESLE